MENNSVNFIFNEHFIEHLSEADGFILLRESYRVLRKNGVLRVCTPSLDKYVEYFLKETKTDVTSGFRNGTQFLNYAIYGEGWTPGVRVEYLKELSNKKVGTFLSPGVDHRYIYSLNDIIEKLKFIGFKNIISVEWGDSKHKDLCNLEHHKNRMELIIEATK
jgi:ubiquinone/menaquinone biosynthesis C-methylase UbiE